MAWACFDSSLPKNSPILNQLEHMPCHFPSAADDLVDPLEKKNWNWPQSPVGWHTFAAFPADPWHGISENNPKGFSQLSPLGHLPIKFQSAGQLSTPLSESFDRRIGAPQASFQ